MIRRTQIWSLCFVTLAFASLAHAVDPPAPAEIPERSLNCPAKFIVSLASDLKGNLWVGTEDSGVYRYTADTAGSGQWQQFTTRDGLGDNNAYAITCDKQGRIWIGHLNHGVSVFNGQKWQNYNVVQGLPRDGIPEKNDPTPALAGPLGPRVFALATCPTDGDVWIGTDAGLSRYSQKSDTWSYVTRTEGLPADQIAALTFAKDGTIYAATQCDGLAIASPEDQYAKWRTFTGPDRIPVTATGEGLPSNLINCLLVTADDTLFVGTTTGLSWSRDHGKSFSFLRGKNYADKVKGLYGGPPRGWIAPNKQSLDKLLSEDYINAITQDDDGLLWIAYRQAGYQIIDPKTDQQYKSVDDPTLAKTDGYISVILTPPNSDPIVARYGGAINAFIRKRKATTTAPASQPAPERLLLPSLPNGAKLPAMDELRAMTTRLSKMPDTSAVAAYVGDDWITRGDWVGRYGRQSAVLCAAGTPTDHLCAWGNDYKVDRHIGPHIRDKDVLRGWIHWLSTDNPKVLYDPLVQTRLQAEWDDHSETYPNTFDGPDIWTSVEIPAGCNTISLYFFNKDGHDWNNRFRDYTVELKTFNSDLSAAYSAPVLARTRVKDFWGGVYKQFIVAKPGKYLIRIARNYSFCTILSAVFVDRLDLPKDQDKYEALPGMVDVKYMPPSIPASPKNPADSSILSLWSPPGMPLVYQEANRLHSVLALRAAQEGNAASEFAGAWRWHLRIWTDDDRAAFNKTMARGRKAAAWQEAYNAAWQKYLDARKAGVTGPIKVNLPPREKDEP